VNARAQKSRAELAERMLNTVLTISIANPLAELLTEALDEKWYEDCADAIRSAAPEDAAAMMARIFDNSLKEAQRRASK